MKTIGKLSVKDYVCRACGRPDAFKTNHWGAVYPYCPCCRMVSFYGCQEAPPEGYGVPEEWKIIPFAEIGGERNEVTTNRQARILFGDSM